MPWKMGVVAPKLANFGPPPGAEKITKFGVYTGQTGGGLVTFELHAPSVPAAQAGVIWDQYKAPADMVIKSLAHANWAVGGGAGTFRLTNATKAHIIINDTIPASGTAGEVSTFAAAGREFVSKGDVLQLVMTTGAGDTITELNVTVLAQIVGAPDNT